MQAKMFFRWAWVFTLLVGFCLGCKLVEGVSEVVAFATQVDLEALATDFDMGALPTEFNLENLATEMEGFATEIDTGAFETQMGSVSTQMGALSTEFDLNQIMTQMPPLQGTLVVFATPSGFPPDIPLLDGERLILGGTANSLQYAARAELATAVEFYRREMAARGWVETANTRVLDQVAVLGFQLGNRTAEVTLAEDFFFGVIVSIKLEG